MHRYSVTIRDMEASDDESTIRAMWEEHNEGDLHGFSGPYGDIISIEIIDPGPDGTRTAIVVAETHEKQIADRVDGWVYEGVVL